jgi:hypothetical protein
MQTLKRKREIDYNEALEVEIKLKSVIENQFNIKLNYTHRYHIFDYATETNEIYVELKNRKCNSNTYPSVLIGQNKIREAEKLKLENKTIYFVFKYLDCIKYWKFDKIEDSWLGVGHRQDRGIYESSPAVFIPHNILSDFI